MSHLHPDQATPAPDRTPKRKADCVPDSLSDQEFDQMVRRAFTLPPPPRPQLPHRAADTATDPAGPQLLSDEQLDLLAAAGAPGQAYAAGKPGVQSRNKPRDKPWP